MGHILKISVIPTISAIICLLIFTALSVCNVWVTRCLDHIGWNTSKIISPQNSDKIVMWRLLRNSRLFFALT